MQCGTLRDGLDEERSDDVENVSEELVDVECEDIAAVQVFPHSNHIYSLHIVYSPTYQVPVLYFNGRSQGAPTRQIESLCKCVREGGRLT